MDTPESMTSLQDVPASEVAQVRALACRVAELAASDRMAAIRKRWRDVNELRTPDRAPVWCRPVGCWSELLPDAQLACRHPVVRPIERMLRQTLIKDEIGDDSIVHPWVEVTRHFTPDPPNIWGVDVVHHTTGDAGGAWGYNPPIRDAEDLALLRAPRFRHDPEETRRRAEITQAVLGDALPVRVRFGGAFQQLLSATIGTYVANLLGMTEMMLHMATEPDLVHRVTRLVADAVRDSNRFLEAEGLLDPNNDAPMSMSDDFGPAPGPDGKRKLANLWCATNSQEYDQVSPAMWREFCLDVQRPLFAQFGRVIYGCCENLTHKIDDVLAIPNLRVFVCSAWTKLDVVLEKTGPQHVIMWRQKASDVVLPHTLDDIRRDLNEGARRLKGRAYQVVLRELQTLAGHPDRLKDWTRLAIEAAERHR